MRMHVRRMIFCSRFRNSSRKHAIISRHGQFTLNTCGLTCAFSRPPARGYPSSHSWQHHDICTKALLRFAGAGRDEIKVETALGAGRPIQPLLQAAILPSEELPAKVILLPSVRIGMIEEFEIGGAAHIAFPGLMTRVEVASSHRPEIVLMAECAVLWERQKRANGPRSVRERGTRRALGMRGHQQSSSRSLSSSSCG